MKLSQNAGFTLIELVIIIVILGILAAIAIPKYQDMSADAKEAACRSALGALRSGITIYYANQAVRTGNADWPPYDSIAAVGSVMEFEIPKNPFCPDDAAPDSIVIGTTKGTTVGARGGWAYDTISGQIWPNTSVLNENNW